MRQRRARAAVVLALATALAAGGCSARWAYRQGQKEAKKGNWDLAVARLTRALGKDPDNIRYKIALENARVQASRQHYGQAQRHMAADALERALDELEIAVKYDSANQAAAEDLRLARERIERLEEEKRRLGEFEAMKSRAQAARVPLPVLSPRDAAPISLKFSDTSLQKIFETLGRLAGVNVVFDEAFRDKRTDVNMAGVTFQQALDQLTLINRLFYKVIDQNTVIVIPDNAQKRRAYDDVLVRTFYLQNADVNETLNLVKQITGITRAVANPSLGAVTVLASPDKMALAARIIETNDKPRGEVVVEVEILEVNRTNIKRYGIELSNYEAAATLSPTGAEGEVSGGFTAVRAHVLSSLNLSDFVVNIPSTLFARFLQTDSTVRILASPRLRAAEGKKTSLSIGTEVPIPVTTFTATQAGTTTFAPATSFQYRNVGVTLELTPKVSAGGEITLELLAEFSLLGEDRNVGTGQNPIIVPTFLARKVNGILRLRDGQTSLIGGLLQGRDSDTFRGALGLQNVPILNKLFTSTQRQKEETEILISITPHLVRAPKVTEADLLPLYAGSEEMPRVPGARPPLFGPPEVAPSPAPSPALPPSPEASPPAPAPTPSPAATPPSPATPAPPGAAPTSPAGEGRAASALWSPSEASIRTGESASVSLVVMGARDLLGVEVAFTYDPTLLEAVEVAAGPLLTLDGATVTSDRSVESGRVRARFTRPTATVGSGVVLAFRFKALRPGTGLLTIESLTLTTGAGGERPAPPGPGRVVVLP